VYRVTIRQGPKVQRSSHEELSVALAELERALAAVDAKRDPVHWIGREIEPVQQVVARGEVSGRGAHGGIDLRGDGSSEAFTGRWRRTLVTQERGETAYAALRRALTRTGAR
jgi:hypothetical protein